MQERDGGDTSVVKTLFAHNTWANVKLLDFCAQLNDEQLDTAAVGGYGSIRDTLQHIVRAEVGYVERVNGKLPPDKPVPNQPVSFEQMKSAARWAGDELLLLALAARDDRVVQQRPPRELFRYPLASLMMQALTHSTEHRTQISAIITQLGLEPPDMSGWQYMDEMGELHEAQAETPV